MLGRWISRDPIGENGGVNLYAQVENATVNDFDFLRMFNSSYANGFNGGMLAPLYTPPPPYPSTPFDKWYEQERKDLSWNDKLPACPCKLPKEKKCSGYGGGIGASGSGGIREYEDFGNPDPNTWEDSGDPNYPWASYHPGAARCMRSKALTGTRSGEQCCYDSSGNFITGGAGSGSADKGSPSNGFFDNIFGSGGHQTVDVAPWDPAQSLDGNTYGPNTKKYQDVRQANNKNGCKQNVK